MVSHTSYSISFPYQLYIIDMDRKDRQRIIGFCKIKGPVSPCQSGRNISNFWMHKSPSSGDSTVPEI